MPVTVFAARTVGLRRQVTCSRLPTLNVHEADFGSRTLSPRAVLVTEFAALCFQWSRRAVCWYLMFPNVQVLQSIDHCHHAWRG